MAHAQHTNRRSSPRHMRAIEAGIRIPEKGRNPERPKEKRNQLAPVPRARDKLVGDAPCMAPSEMTRLFTAGFILAFTRLDGGGNCGPVDGERGAESVERDGERDGGRE